MLAALQVDWNTITVTSWSRRLRLSLRSFSQGFAPADEDHFPEVLNASIKYVATSRQYDSAVKKGKLQLRSDKNL